MAPPVVASYFKVWTQSMLFELSIRPKCREYEQPLVASEVLPRSSAPNMLELGQRCLNAVSGRKCRYGQGSWGVYRIMFSLESDRGEFRSIASEII